MPQRAATFSVNAAPQELWRFLRDFRALCTCIPGVEKINVVDGKTAELTVKEKVGVIPLIVELKASIDSEDPPRRLHATATGEHLSIAIDVALERKGSTTELRSLFEVKGEGPLKPVVDRLFEKRATERTAQFAACLERRFGGSPAPATERPPSAGWLARLWRRLVALFTRRAP